MNKLRLIFLLVSVMVLSVYFAGSVSAEGNSVYDWITKFNSVFFGITGAQVSSSGDSIGVVLSPPCSSYGDVTGDGYISQADVGNLSWYIVRKVDGEVFKKYGDVNDDGSVNVLDMTKIERYIAGLDTTFPACDSGNDSAVCDVVIVDESEIVSKEDCFVVGEYTLQYKRASRTTASGSQTAKFFNRKSGETLEYSTTAGAGKINIGGVSYMFVPASSTSYDDYDIKVDLNGDGIIGAKKCTDSDGGKNYYAKGIAKSSVSGFEKQETDSCSWPGDKNKLLEYSCTDKGLYSEWYNCPNGCENGACMKGKEPYCEAIGSRSEGWYRYGELIAYGSCGGCYAVCEATETKSEGWYSSCNGGLIKYEECGEEKCRGEDYGCYVGSASCCNGLKEVLLAFEAEDGQCIASTCGSICRPCGNGVCDENENKCNCPEDCKESLCVDSDNSKPNTPDDVSHYIKGYVKYADYVYNDACVDWPGPNYVKEYECSEGKVIENEYDCSNGCYNGACVIDDETMVISKDDYFALTAGVLRYRGALRSTSSNPTMKFQDVENGEVIEISYFSDSSPIAYIKKDGKSYGVWAASSTAYNDFDIKVDLNGDGMIGSNVTCYDSDGGKNYYVSGYTTIDGGVHMHWDACGEDVSTGNEFLDEAFCYGNEEKRESYYCPYGCNAGACVEEFPPAPPSEAFTNKIQLNQGWNLIGTFLTHSDGVAKVETDCDRRGNILAAYYYDPVARRYVDMLVASEEEAEEEKTVTEVLTSERTCEVCEGGDDTGRVDEYGCPIYVCPEPQLNIAMVENVNSFWIKVANSCSLAFKIDEPYGWLAEMKQSGKQLAKGWNFLGVVPDMVGHTIGNFEGSCRVKSAYVWDSSGRQWETLGVVDVGGTMFKEAAVGYGFVVKVTDDCFLSIDGGPVDSPPELPEDEVSG